jgi:hypothetical protein
VTDAVVLHPITTVPPEPAVVTIEANGPIAHVGLLYQFDDDQLPRHLHLAGHLRLQDDPVAPPEAFWVEPRLSEDELEIVADTAHLIATRHQAGRIPYAFDPADAQFSDGALQLNQSRGLTCATFVLLLFEYVGIRLVQKETWEQHRSEMRQREDAEIQRKLVKYMQRDRDPDVRAHAEEVAGEIGSTRIRAEEVAATSGMTGHPIPFARAEPEGRSVLERIRGQRAGAA